MGIWPGIMLSALLTTIRLAMTSMTMAIAQCFLVLSVMVSHATGR